MDFALIELFLFLKKANLLKGLGRKMTGLRLSGEAGCVAKKAAIPFWFYIGRGYNSNPPMGTGRVFYFYDLISLNL